MTELKDLVTQPALEASSPFRIARVISLVGRSLTVDFGSGAAGTVVQAVVSCAPRPGDNVLVAMDGNRPIAVGVLNDPYRQAVLVTVSSTSTTVTGLLNGVSTAVTKAGAFTVSPGDNLPLIWSADGSAVWVLGKAGAAYVPPPPTGGGGGGGGGGSTPGSYTSSYAATSSGVQLLGGNRQSGDLNMGFTVDYGYYQYGYGRFNELVGKTILSGQIYLPRTLGSGSVTLQVDGAGGSSSATTGGWTPLSLTRLNDLISRPIVQMVEMKVYGSGSLRGIPAGTVQITWR